MSRTASANGTARLAGTPFWKMTGSGNDFVFLDVRTQDSSGLDSAAVVAELCSRTDGIGADGIVLLERDAEAAFRIRYYNRDGSRGELCGNASLCSARLATRLGIAPPTGFRFQTDAGPITARIVAGLPEIEMPPVRGLSVDAGIPAGPGERRIGFADTGVPHLVVLVDDVSTVDLMHRGRELRHDRSLAAGANVNFIAAASPDWRMRTYERGVEAETLACGTGSVAVAALLAAWGLVDDGAAVRILTTSGRTLLVTLPDAGRPHTPAVPALRGEGRIVFSGRYGDI